MQDRLAFRWSTVACFVPLFCRKSRKYHNDIRAHFMLKILRKFRHKWLISDLPSGIALISAIRIHFGHFGGVNQDDRISIANLLHLHDIVRFGTSKADRKCVFASPSLIFLEFWQTPSKFAFGTGSRRTGRFSCLLFYSVVYLRQ